MRIIDPGGFRAMRWANGGGSTHEIAREDRAGKLLWRLSIATVAEDSAFSRFEGLARVLTVIEGAGMVLETPEGRLEALRFRPVQFSGELPVMARLIAGPLRDFNVIHDPTQIAAEVRVLVGPAEAIVDAGQGGVVAVLSVAGVIQADGEAIPTGGVALGAKATIRLADGARGILAILRPLDQTGISAQ